MAKKLNAVTGMPQMKVAFSGWKRNVSLIVRTTAIDADGFNQPVETTETFKGTVQPLSAEALELKPDAQRGFEWLQIHVEVGGLSLKVGDQITYNSRNYVVQAKKDYSLNNYIEYHAMEGTQNG